MTGCATVAACVRRAARDARARAHRARRPRRGRGGAEALRARAVARHHAATSGAVERSTDDAEHLEHQLAAEAARARESVWTTIPGSTCREHAGHEHARALELDDADAADVDRREVLQDSRASGSRSRRRGTRRGSSCPRARSTRWPSMISVDRRSSAATAGAGGCGSGAAAAGTRSARGSSTCLRSAIASRRIADSIALEAVCPRPQIDASRITCPSSSRSAHLVARRADRAAARGAVQQLLLPHGADAAGHALAARLVAEERGDAAQRCRQVDGVVEDHDDARAERRAGRARALEGQRQVELVRADERARGAAEQDRLELRPSGTPPASSSSSPQRDAERHLVEPGLLRRCRETQKSWVPVEPARADPGERGAALAQDVRARSPASRRCSRRSACRRARPGPGRAACCAARRAGPRSS